MKGHSVRMDLVVYRRVPRRKGFTLVEVVIAMTVGMIALTVTGIIFMNMVQQVKSGTSQTFFISDAHRAEQRIDSQIKKSRLIATPETTRLLLYDIQNRETEIEFENPDGSLDTIDDNQIVMTAPNGLRTILCSAVAPIDSTTPMFEVLTNRQRAVRVAFHVGDAPEGSNENKYKTGPGFQGVQVLFTSSARNLQRFYQ